MPATSYDSLAAQNHLEQHSHWLLEHLVCLLQRQQDSSCPVEGIHQNPASHCILTCCIFHFASLLPHAVTPTQPKRVHRWARCCSQFGDTAAAPAELVLPWNVSSGSHQSLGKPVLHQHENLKFHVAFQTSNYSVKKQTTHSKQTHRRLGMEANFSSPR